MIVVKQCKKCERIYDVEFMSHEQCQCVTAKKNSVTKNNKKRIRNDKWDNIPVRDLPSIQNRREKEAEMIMSVFHIK